MRRTTVYLMSVVAILFATLTLADPAPDKPDVIHEGVPPAPTEIDFNRDVRPILARRCLVCHGPDQSTREAGLRLDVRESATADRGDLGGPVIVPGDSASSLLIKRVSADDPDDRMPPRPHPAISTTEIETLRRWIDQGAPYAQHWSWEPIRQPDLPTVDDQDWVRDPLDTFILARLESAGLKPNGQADKRTLIRRVSFDLIGLPPTPEEVEAFLNDDSPNAFERVVDRLLASPHFGERWGRHWLDLMRYAETHGHEFDYPIKYAHEYRDYVIRAFNADVPYDSFVTEHVAGDLLEHPRRHPDEGYNESALATGFWFLSQGTHAPVDVRADEAERVANQIDVFSKSFLGLTVSCARCHDHKFDAISTADFYALAGFLQSSRRLERFMDPHREIERVAADLESRRVALSEMTRGSLEDGVDLAASLRLLSAAAEVVAGEPTPGDLEAWGDMVVYDDFEGDTYADHWTVEGTAFGARPQTEPTIAPHQGKVRPRGNGFVNSHTVHTGGPGKGADKNQGRLVSAPFTLEHDYIHFMIGGGSHAGRTCFNLVLDDKIIATATGRNHNEMHAASFDVKAWKGREVHFEIVDAESGGWGHIGLDHIVLTDRDSLPGGDESRPLGNVAAEFNVDIERLRRAVDVLKQARDRTDHPLHAWVKTTQDGPASVRQMFATPPDPDVSEHAFATFAGETWMGWTSHGAAFGERPLAKGDTILDEANPRFIDTHAAHSGRLHPRFRGILHSPTFEITTDLIEYRLSGTGCRIRLIIDGYFLNEYNALLFGGIQFDVSSDSPWTWRTHIQDVSRYKGHRAYIEVIDEGDGFVALDEVRFVNARSSHDRRNEAIGDAIRRVDADDTEQLRSAHATAFARAIMAVSTGTPTSDQVDLVNSLVEAGVLADSAHAGLQLEINTFAELAKEIPVPRRALSLADGTGEDEYVFVRGSHRQIGDVVPRRFVESIAGANQSPIPAGSGRLTLAERMLEHSNPFPSRVMVNRVWHHLFGRGIVATTDDFGGLGQPPTHPHLLDHLSHWYQNEGAWSTKALIRRMVLSSTYQMSSEVDATSTGPRLDPTNTLLHRARIRRLQAEPIRDAVLAVSGRLDRTMYGPPVAIHLTDFMTGRGRPGRSGPLDGEGRRSIYLEIRRNFLSPMMQAFDAPVPSTTVGNRHVSNVPAQALILMNDPFVVEEARRWAERVIRDIPDSPEDRIRLMYLEALSREPSSSELGSATEFLEAVAMEREVEDWADNLLVWSDMAHVMFNLKEFIFIH